MTGPTFDRAADSRRPWLGPASSKPLTATQRREVAAQLEALLAAVPADPQDPRDVPLRQRLEAYVAGLRGTVPKPLEEPQSNT